MRFMKGKTRNIFLDIAFAAALFLKVFGAGFSYFCILDDHIQYGCYPLAEKLSNVLFGIGTASNRPLAALFDPLVWGAFFENMAIALLIITILHFLSAKLFDKCLVACDISITPIFYAVYLLLPLGFEGTYWISASSRIVVGLFFTALAVWLLIQYIHAKKWYLLTFYILCSLASFGFYESVSVLSGLMQGLIILHFTYKKKAKKLLYLLVVPALSVAALLLYYRLFSTVGVMGNRVSQFSFDQMGARTKEFFLQFGHIFSIELYRTTILGFIDGAKHLLQNGITGYLVLCLILIISLFCAYFSTKCTISSPKAPYCIIAGLLLIFLPLLPNLLVTEVWLTYRSIVVCLLGFCVLLAPLFSMLLRKRKIAAVTVFLVTTLFLTACINEVNTYQTVGKADKKMATDVVNHLDDQVLAGNKETILVLEKEVVVPQTAYYKDHVKSVFYTDWSLTGAVRAISMRTVAKNTEIQTITPVYSLENIDTTGKQILYMNASYQITEERND